MNRLIGVTGFARSGKDTFYERSKALLEKNDKKACRFAFADALKNECDTFLKEHTGISAFTEDSKEKEMIRPFLVTYGTDIRRKLDQNCWIKTIQQDIINKLDEGYFVFVTDVRFKNEAEWIKMNGGFVVNVNRDGVGPANHHEHQQSHFYKALVSYNVQWPTYGPDELDKCDEHVLPLLAHMIKREPAVRVLM